MQSISTAIWKKKKKFLNQQFHIIIAKTQYNVNQKNIIHMIHLIKVLIYVGN